MKDKFGPVSGKYGIDMSELGPFFDPDLEEQTQKTLDPAMSSPRKVKKKHSKKGNLNLPKIDGSSKLNHTASTKFKRPIWRDVESV